MNTTSARSERSPAVRLADSLDYCLQYLSLRTPIVCHLFSSPWIFIYFLENGAGFLDGFASSLTFGCICCHGSVFWATRTTRPCWRPTLWSGESFSRSVTSCPNPSASWRSRWWENKAATRRQTWRTASYARWEECPQVASTDFKRNFKQQQVGRDKRTNKGCN